MSDLYEDDILAVGRVMAIEIVNAEEAPLLPRTGRFFNAQYSDGVVKVRWSEARGDWETALSDWPVAFARIPAGHAPANMVAIRRELRRR